MYLKSFGYFSIGIIFIALVERSGNGKFNNSSELMQLGSSWDLNPRVALFIQASFF